jgi:hypothetical protein
MYFVTIAHPIPSLSHAERVAWEDMKSLLNQDERVNICLCLTASRQQGSIGRAQYFQWS